MQRSCFSEFNFDGWWVLLFLSVIYKKAYFYEFHFENRQDFFAMGLHFSLRENRDNPVAVAFGGGGRALTLCIDLVAKVIILPMGWNLFQENKNLSGFFTKLTCQSAIRWRK